MLHNTHKIVLLMHWNCEALKPMNEKPQKTWSNNPQVALKYLLYKKLFQANRKMKKNSKTLKNYQISMLLLYSIFDDNSRKLIWLNFTIRKHLFFPFQMGFDNAI